jgi:LmbE family N-acetylglucosaminyl deacetylase
MKSIQIVLFLLSLTVQFSLIAQPVTELSSSEILHGIKKLNTVGSVLYIAAHPDDENTRLLPYLSNEQNLRTAYLSLTRGDGGQNLIGKEQGEPLGLIRTQELLSARRADGAEQFFTRANDFGYSKNPDETFSIWNKDSILADVVWVIRMYKPDVIICRFPTTGEGGHGHHTASAILASEAFDAAADPKRFPEQLRYVQVWRTKRLFWNTFNFGGTNTTSPDQIMIDVGGYNTLLGKSYGEIASESRSMHKSQGFGTAKTRGTVIEYFKQIKGDTVKKDLFEGINISWTRFPQTAKYKKIIDKLIEAYNPQFPEKSLKDLITFYTDLSKTDQTDPIVTCWIRQKIKATETLILACSGLYIETCTSDFIAVPGNDIKTTIQIIKRHNTSIILNKIIYLKQSDTSLALTLKTNELYTFKHTEKLNANHTYSGPYWLNESHGVGRYQVNNPLMVGKAENDPAAKVTFDITIQGLNLIIDQGVFYKFTDPVKGEIYRPFEVLPPVTINVSEKVFVFNDSSPKKIRFIVKGNTTNVNGTLQLKAPAGWYIMLSDSTFRLTNKGDEVILEAMVKRTSISMNGKLTVAVSLNGVINNKSINRIEYDHIPYQFILSNAETNLISVSLIKSGNSIGYIPGAGDDIVSCLKQIGYNVTVLSDDAIRNDDLSVYDAIVTGIRAYNTNNQLQVNYDKLMKYVSDGGNLVVQYNTNNRIGPLLAKIGPYPFTISRDRVTDETAEIHMLDTLSPVLNFPNKITSRDFENWIQERGIYFASDLDSHYQTLLATNDPNEKSLNGSLIVSKYGKGNFVYTGLAFFRELPAGVSGSYRLFVNLLSIPENK